MIERDVYNSKKNYQNLRTTGQTSRKSFGALQANRGNLKKMVNLMSNVHQVEEGKYIKREKDNPQLNGTTEPNDVKDLAEIGSPKLLTKLQNGNQEDPLEVMNF